VRRSICASEPRRASTRVSPGFALPRHRSPSFGSQPGRSHASLRARGRRVGGGCGPRGGPERQQQRRHPAWHLHCARAVGPQQALAGGLVSSVRVSRRAEGRAVVAPTRAGCGRGPAGAQPRAAPASAAQEPLPAAAQRRPRTHRTTPGNVHAPRAAGDPHSSCATPAPRFPLSTFRHSCTLSPESFAPFPRGTCPLSVSHGYSALGGAYHPLRAAVPSSSTRRGARSLARTPALRRGLRALHGALTLPGALFQGTWRGPGRRARRPCRPHPGVAAGSQPGLGPSSLAVTGGVLVRFSSLRLLICLSPAGPLA
jgi:hypothetical protein